jgi:hypothetical protein
MLPDRRQFGLYATCFIAQQYSPASILSMRFRSRNHKISEGHKYVIIIIWFWLCLKPSDNEFEFTQYRKCLYIPLLQPTVQQHIGQQLDSVLYQYSWKR